MNPIRQWIDELLATVTKRAVINQIKRQLDEKLFIFAIEIGRGKRLMPDQRRVFAKTFRTAQIMLLLDEELTNRPPKMKPIRNIMKEPEEEWLLKEPVIKAELESRLKYPLTEFDEAVISRAERTAIIRYLCRISKMRPGLLSINELRSIVERLDHPLDRA
jgi:hypothetical protein